MVPLRRPQADVLLQGCSEISGISLPDTVDALTTNDSFSPPSQDPPLKRDSKVPDDVCYRHCIDFNMCREVVCTDVVSDEKQYPRIKNETCERDHRILAREELSDQHHTHMLQWTVEINSRMSVE